MSHVVAILLHLLVQHQNFNSLTKFEPTFRLVDYRCAKCYQMHQETISILFDRFGKYNTSEMKRVPTAEQIENKCLPREFIVDELVEKRHFRFLARKLGVYLLHFTVYLLVIGMQRDVRNGFKLHVAGNIACFL